MSETYISGSSSSLLKTLRGEKTSIPPIWLMRQAGRYLPEYRKLRSEAGSFLDLCYTSEFAVEVTLQPITRYKMDGAILFSDILVVPDGLGWDVDFKEGLGPILTKLTHPEQLKTLSIDAMCHHLTPVFETIKKLRQNLPAETALIGFSGAPWTLATYMIEGGSSKDYAKSKSFAYAYPKVFQDLISFLTDAIIQYLKLQIDAGAQIIQIFDSWAGVIPTWAVDQFCYQPILQITSALNAYAPNIPIIGFPKGIGQNYDTFARMPGLDGLALDTTIDVNWARKTFPKQLVLQGNLDPAILLADQYSSEGRQLMHAEIDRLKTAFSDQKYIFNLGHGVIKETDPESVLELVSYIRS